MRLAEFIENRQEKIIEEWVRFASTLLPWAKNMTDKGLRDHAKELLAAVVIDMQAPQSDDEQTRKSQGKAALSALGTIGHQHASQRLATGFNLDQLLSEYRALRASILRLWEEEKGEEHSDVTRFNEAIDESLTEATVRYSAMLERTREQFLGILGHDLRTPLSAIAMGATLLTESDGLPDKETRVAARILTSAGRMSRMVNDLLDLTRSRFGAGIPVSQKPMDLMSVCDQIISELETAYPERELHFESNGDLSGEWDSDRITQVLTNLMANALQYGGEFGPVTLAAKREGEEVVLSVHNEGPPIPANALEKVFEPMVRQPGPRRDANASGLGLGLYIAREIVTAHGGTIGVTSSQGEGTTFTARIPRFCAQREAKS